MTQSPAFDRDLRDGQLVATITKTKCTTAHCTVAFRAIRSVAWENNAKSHFTQLRHLVSDSPIEFHPLKGCSYQVCERAPLHRVTALQPALSHFLADPLTPFYPLNPLGASLRRCRLAELLRRAMSSSLCFLLNTLTHAGFAPPFHYPNRPAMFH